MDGEQNNSEEFFDLILDITSVEKLNCEGFKVIMTEKGSRNYELNKKKDNCVVGVVGNAKVGKTYILSKILQSDLPAGFSASTKGISVKYPENQNQNQAGIIALDTAGFENPLRETNECKYKDVFLKISDGADEANIQYKEKKDNLIKNEDKKKPKEMINEEENEEVEKEEEEDDELKEINKTKYYEVVRDRQHTEYLIQSFVVTYSNILIVVVGQLTFQDQKLLNRIKSEHSDKDIYFIHNLFNFTQISQVKEYISNTLEKSLTFLLKEEKLPEEVCNPKGSVNDTYFLEDSMDTPRNNVMVHLLLALESSEAGNFYNTSTFAY